MLLITAEIQSVAEVSVLQIAAREAIALTYDVAIEAQRTSRELVESYRTIAANLKTLFAFCVTHYPTAEAVIESAIDDVKSEIAQLRPYWDLFVMACIAVYSFGYACAQLRDEYVAECLDPQEKIEGSNGWVMPSISGPNLFSLPKLPEFDREWVELLAQLSWLGWERAAIAARKLWLRLR